MTLKVKEFQQMKGGSLYSFETHLVESLKPNLEAPYGMCVDP